MILYGAFFVIVEKYNLSIIVQFQAYMRVDPGLYLKLNGIYLKYYFMNAKA
jgi:hypothetical protein